MTRTRCTFVTPSGMTYVRDVNLEPEVVDSMAERLLAIKDNFTPYILVDVGSGTECLVQINFPATRGES